MKFTDTMANARSGLRTHYDHGVDAALGRLGLQQKRSAWEMLVPSLGLVTCGLAIGALVGLAFAPKRGEELRHDLRDRLDDIKDQSVERYERLIERARQFNGAAAGQIEHSEERGFA